MRTCNKEGAAALAPASVAGTGGGLFGLGTAATIAIFAGYGTIVSLPFIFGNRDVSSGQTDDLVSLPED